MDSPYAKDLAFTEALAMDAAAILSGGVKALGDDALRAALQECIDARSLVAPEQAKVRALIRSADTHVERAYREYQHALINLQIERAAKVAEKRLQLLDSLKSEGDYERERALCRRGLEGTIYWFQMYA